MRLQSIYGHMEKGAEKVPYGENCKIIFRHSIRGKIESDVGREVELTDEGVEQNVAKRLDGLKSA